MQLLRQMSLDRIETHSRRWNTSKRECVGSCEHLDLADDRIAESNVEAEGMNERPFGQRATDAKPQSFVRNSVSRDPRRSRVWRDLEAEEVAEILGARLTENCESPIGPHRHSEIDVGGRSCAIHAKFESKPALEEHVLSEHRTHAREQSIEREQMATALYDCCGLRAGSESLIERATEILGAPVAMRVHGSSPP